MIVWIASYPRSGNTLLRQILKATMDLDSCEERETPAKRRIQYEGFVTPSLPWKQFYAHAKASCELFFIKTHKPPCDDNKALFVVRDGRSAVQSYVHFLHRKKSSCTLASVILGCHGFGDWTTHYRAWASRPQGKNLLLHFRDLVDAAPELLRRIAEFIGHRGTIKPWVNPFAQMHQQNPHFFRKGEALWKPEPLWTEADYRLFQLVHGPVMVELGYCAKEELNQSLPDSDHPRNEAQVELSHWLLELARQQRQWLEQQQHRGFLATVKRLSTGASRRFVNLFRRAS